MKYNYQIIIIPTNMDDFWIIVAIVDLISAQLIAQYIGRKRKIGYGKSVFWAIVLGPIIGLIIALSSKRIAQE
jgi:uncharacterized protein YqgC (DUF456 family)